MTDVMHTERQARPAPRRLSRTASCCGSACDQQEMWPDAEHLWHIGAAAGDIKYRVPRRRNTPSFRQVRQVSPGTLDRLQRHDTEACLLDLGTQFVGAVTVAGQAAGKERRHDA